MNEQVRDQFNAFSVDYDARRRLLIPCFDEFYGTGVERLTFTGEAPKVLDAGAGTGIYSDTLLSRYPKARLTLIDFAESMLDIARGKFEGRADARFITDDYYTHSFGGEQYDIVISALSIHHLDTDGKMAFYKKVYGLLGDGGEFVNADIACSGDPEADARDEALWTDFVAGNLGEGESLDRFIKSKEVDKPSPVPDQLTWLREAGFTAAECVFRHLNFAVIYARK